MVAAIIRIYERAAAGRDDHVPFGRSSWSTARSAFRKYGSPSRREDRRDAQALAGLDAVVDVLESPADPAAQRAGDGGLAGAHESHKIEFVSFHARRDSSTEKNSGYETAAAPAS
jgi:hypothetical protein